MVSSISDFAQTYWWATVVGVALIVWSFWAWRRARRGATRVARAPTGSIPAGVFRRNEFEAKVAFVDAAIHKRLWAVLLLVIVGLPGLLLLKWAAPTIHGSIFPTSVYILLALVIVSYFAVNITVTRLARQIGLVCSGCQLVLAGTMGAPRLARRLVDVVLATGRCPKCDRQLLDNGDASSAGVLTREHKRQ